MNIWLKVANFNKIRCFLNLVYVGGAILMDESEKYIKNYEVFALFVLCKSSLDKQRQNCPLKMCKWNSYH